MARPAGRPAGPGDGAGSERAGLRDGGTSASRNGPGPEVVRSWRDKDWTRWKEAAGSPRCPLSAPAALALRWPWEERPGGVGAQTPLRSTSPTPPSCCSSGRAGVLARPHPGGLERAQWPHARLQGWVGHADACGEHDVPPGRGARSGVSPTPTSTPSAVDVCPGEGPPAHHS